MSEQTVNEGSTAYLTVTLLDKDGAQAAPSALSYQIDDVTTGTTVRSATALAAAAQVEITLAPTDNAIQTATNKRERRRVTVQASYGAGDALNAEYDYIVRNLSGV